jgi:hypothetical protein
MHVIKKISQLNKAMRSNQNPIKLEWDEFEQKPAMQTRLLAVIFQ